MVDLRALAERALHLQPGDRWLAEVHDRITVRRRQRLAAVGALGVVLVGIGVVAGTGNGGALLRDPAPLSPPDSTTGGEDRASTADGLFLAGKKLYVSLAAGGLPRPGAVAGGNEHAHLVLRYFGDDQGRGGDGKSRVWLYDDGRLITVREAFGVPRTYLERRLTPEGFEMMRARVIDHSSPKRLDPPDWPYAAWLEVRDGGSLVELDPFMFDSGLVTTPESWLPARAWSDRRPVPYVPSHFGVCYYRTAHPGAATTPEEILDALPASVRGLLPHDGWTTPAEVPSGSRCAIVSTDRAREVFDVLRRQGSPGTQSDWQHVRGSLTFEVILPDGSPSSAAGG